MRGKNITSRNPYNILALLLLLIVCAFFGLNFPFSANAFVQSNYTFLFVGLIICSVLLGIKLYKQPLFIFDPFLFSSLLSFCIFLIQPMNDILKNEMFYGYMNAFSGCQKGTFVFVISYVMFCLVYFITKNKIPRHNKIYQSFKGNQFKISLISLIIWLVSLAGCVGFFLANGYNLSYIFTLGNLGEANIDEIFARMGFLWKFSFSLIGSFMYYWVCGHNRLLKAVMWVITCIILVANGGRAVLLIFLFAPLVYYYAKHTKNPPIRYIVMWICVFCIISAVIQTFRWEMRSGGDVQMSMLWNMENILEPVYTNFRVYKMYYFILDAMPGQLEYVWGKESIGYTFIMLIPRVIWPSKPDAPFREILRYSAGDFAVENGQAFPGLTEPYMDFGLLGCLVYAFIGGWLISKLKNLYLYTHQDSHALVLFSLLYPFLFQVIIRGYVPSLVFSVLFLFLPFIILKLIIPSSNKEKL